MLKVQDLFVAYGGIEALKGISLEVPEGKIVTLIGANGAGKSTLLRTIVGLVKPKSGTISYNEQNITGLNSQKIVKTGISSGRTKGFPESDGPGKFTDRRVYAQ